MRCKNLSNLDYIWNSSTCICENDKYSAIAGVEIIEVTKIVSTETVPINSNCSNKNYSNKNCFNKF